MNPDLVSQIGFPAGIAVILVYWLLKSLNGKLDRNTFSQKENTAALHRLAESLEKRSCPFFTDEEIGKVIRGRKS